MQKKKKILLLVESSSAYGRKIAFGISKYAKERGDWTLHIEDRDVFSIPLQLAQGWKGDGIITRTSRASLRNTLSRLSCPIVELLGVHSGQMREVMPDTYRGMELCIKHYQDKQISSIAYYGFGRNWWIEERRKTFLDITDQFGLTAYCFVDNSAKTPNPQPEWSEKYEKPLTRWLKTLPAQTGLIVACDYQAVRVLNTCQVIGIAVPEQLAILGIDNDEHFCNLATPQLSSLDQNAEMIGYEAAELLNRKMTIRAVRRKNDEITTPILVPPQGVVARRSTEIGAIEDEDVATALRFIAEFALTRIVVSDVVHHVGVSYSTLFRRFHQVLNRSPHDEIIKIRLDHAKFLLAQTNLSIRAIAAKTCYNTVEYFTAVFHRHIGQTPACYRKNAWKFKMLDTFAELSDE